MSCEVYHSRDLHLPCNFFLCGLSPYKWFRVEKRSNYSCFGLGSWQLRDLHVAKSCVC